MHRMKYLGIDYGTKKIGLAVSDANGKIAFPYAIIPTSEKEKQVEAIMAKEHIGEIVIGQSMDLKGQSNKIQEEINGFAAILGMQFGIPVHFVKEFFSSSEARWAGKRGKSVANPHRAGNKSAKANENVDDKAAAIILQRHLDAIQLKHNGR
jgi:putative Holliday junction resolvase